MTDTAPPVPSTTILELPYHRLYRAQPTYLWWRPLVAIVMTVVFFFAVSFAVAIPVLIVLFASGTIDVNNPTSLSQDALLELLAPDMARPWTLLFGLGSIILVLPLVPLALRIAGIRPTGVRVSILHSVLFRLRWRWLFLTLGLSALVWIVTVAGQLGIGLAAGESIGQFTTDPLTYIISIVIVVLLVPIQAATEEYLYRGVLQQSIGAWLRWAPFGIVISAVLFAVSHSYDIWGLLQVGLMGAGFAIVSVRTGGLEAGIAFHTVNNIGSFALSGTGAFGPTGMTSDTGGPLAVIGQIVTIALWVGIIELFARHQKVERLSRIAVPGTGPGILPPYGS
jgi:membrane protease YdiL (CAAX protease family)